MGRMRRFGGWLLSDPHLAALGRKTGIYWSVWAVNIVQISLMLFGPDSLQGNGWFAATNTLGTIALVVMLIALASAHYQERPEKPAQAD